MDSVIIASLISVATGLFALLKPLYQLLQSHVQRSHAAKVQISIKSPDGSVRSVAVGKEATEDEIRKLVQMLTTATNDEAQTKSTR